MLIPGITQARLVVAGIVVAILVGALVKFGSHERQVEVRKAEKVSAIVERQAEAGTEANIVKAAVAARGAEDDSKAIAAYIAAHPARPERVCNQNGGGSQGMRQGHAPVSAPAGGGAGPAAVPKVLGGDEDGNGDQDGVDVGPGVDVILRAAEALDILYRERQRR
jgi:hypothetical protein